jgi:hypothetical protein
MSSGKTSKVVVKSEVTTEKSKKRKRSKENDGDSSDAEEDAQIRLASEVKKAKSEVNKRSSQRCPSCHQRNASVATVMEMGMKRMQSAIT